MTQPNNRPERAHDARWSSPGKMPEMVHRGTFRAHIVDLHEQLNHILGGDIVEPLQQQTAIGLAWSILRESGFPTFGDVRAKRTEEFCLSVPADLRESVSLALDTIGWLEYAPKANEVDRAAQFLERAAALCPLDLTCVEKFSILAGVLKPENIINLRRDPVKQGQTAIGYAMKATKCLEYALENRFAVTSEVLHESSGESLSRLIPQMSDEERYYVARMLGHVAHLHTLQANFFENGVYAGKAIAAGCSALQVVGLPRGIVECVTELQEALRQHTARDVLGEYAPLVLSILESVSRGFHKKWHLFNNHAAGRRSEKIDALCELLEARGSQ